MLLASGEYRNAVALLTSIREEAQLDGNVVRAWCAAVAQGSCLARMGMVREALRVFDGVLRECDMHDVRWLCFQELGKLYSAIGSAEDALRYLEAASHSVQSYVLGQDDDAIARYRLPLLWRLGLHYEIAGRREDAKDRLAEHAELAETSVQQQSNSRSCFAIASIQRGVVEWDDILEAARDAAQGYVRAAKTESTTFWSLKASVSTLIVEALIDYATDRKQRAYLKLHLVRAFLVGRGIAPETEGVAEVIKALKSKCEVIEPIVVYPERRYRAWTVGNGDRARLLRAEQSALELLGYLMQEEQGSIFDVIGAASEEKPGVKMVEMGRRTNVADGEFTRRVLHTEHTKGLDLKRWVRVGVAHIPLELDLGRWPPIVRGEEECKEKARDVLTVMEKESCDVMCFPEFGYVDDEPFWRKASRRKVIVAGTAYMENRNRCRVFIDGECYDVDKLVPSDFEYAELTGDGKGMIRGRVVRVFDTNCGRIGVLVCRDLLSYDGVLSAYDLDLLVVPAHNPSAEGSRRLSEVAQSYVNNNPCYVCISDSGGQGASVLLGRCHRGFLDALNNRGVRGKECGGGEILKVWTPSVLCATVDTVQKGPVIPSPGRPVANVREAKVISGG